jgi:hypothetical protein
MLYGSQRPSCYREGRADGAPPPATSPVSRSTQRREGRECDRYWSLYPCGAGACASHGTEQGHVKETFNHFNANPIPQPSRLAPPLLPHLTGHVTGQMAGQRAVTDHVTGYVRRDRFHALTFTQQAQFHAPTQRREGRGCVSHDYGAVRMCACQGTAQGDVQRDVTANPKRLRKPLTPSVPRYREPYDPRILANTRGEYPVSDSPR